MQLMEMYSGWEATATRPEKQVLLPIGGDNLLACCSVHSPEQRQFLWKAENEN